MTVHVSVYVIVCKCMCVSYAPFFPYVFFLFFCFIFYLFSSLIKELTNKSTKERTNERTILTMEWHDNRKKFGIITTPTKTLTT